MLDGEVLRAYIHRDLGHSPKDRSENVPRISEDARRFPAQGFIVIVSSIAPCRADRARARRRGPEGGYADVFVTAPAEFGIARAPKGLDRGHMPAGDSDFATAVMDA